VEHTPGVATSDAELMALLRSIADGGDLNAPVQRLRELLPTAPPRSWIRELAYIVRHYRPEVPETGEALMALAKMATSLYPCPACEQVVLDRPAWEKDSPSGEICPSCGIQFGYQDMQADPVKRDHIYRLWRGTWLANGRRPVHSAAT
jgi:Zn-finger nucleic acid-binding protein